MSPPGGRNGARRPPRPEIKMVSAGASDAEAAAIAAALEQFLADTAPTPAPEREEQSRWQRAALVEGVGAKRALQERWG